MLSLPRQGFPVTCRIEHCCACRPLALLFASDILCDSPTVNTVTKNVGLQIFESASLLLCKSAGLQVCKSAVCVCRTPSALQFMLGLHFTPVCVLLSVCSLDFTLSLHFTFGPQSAVRSPQSSFYTDRISNCCFETQSTVWMFNGKYVENTPNTKRLLTHRIQLTSSSILASFSIRLSPC